MLLRKPSRRAELQRQIAELQQDKAAAIAKLTAAKHSSEISMHKLQEERDAGVEKVRDLEKTLAKTTADLRAERGEYLDLQHQLQAARKEVLDLLQQLQAAQGELADVRLAERQKTADPGQASDRLREIRALVSTNVATPGRRRNAVWRDPMAPTGAPIE
jgi:DNA repair exonuclease SbcCD ATPase subunit